MKSFKLTVINPLTFHTRWAYVCCMLPAGAELYRKKDKHVRVTERFYFVFKTSQTSKVIGQRLKLQPAKKLVDLVCCCKVCWLYWPVWQETSSCLKVLFYSVNTTEEETKQTKQEIKMIQMNREQDFSPFYFHKVYAFHLTLVEEFFISGEHLHHNTLLETLGI